MIGIIRHAPKINDNYIDNIHKKRNDKVKIYKI